MRILLVDDNRKSRTFGRSILSQLGYTKLTEASDGLEALSQLSAERPDLMLVDCDMPNMDGITLTRTVRESDRSLPIIVCLNETEQSRVVDALKAGVNNYIVKPFTTEIVREKIDQTIAKFATA